MAKITVTISDLARVDAACRATYGETIEERIKTHLDEMIKEFEENTAARVAKEGVVVPPALIQVEKA